MVRVRWKACTCVPDIVLIVASGESAGADILSREVREIQTADGHVPATPEGPAGFDIEILEVHETQRKKSEHDSVDSSGVETASEV